MTALKKLRIKRGYTQKYVHEALGIRQSDFSRYEAGKFTPKLETAILIAEFYKIETVAELKKLFEI